jgi:hypothetical protein
MGKPAKAEKIGEPLGINATLWKARIVNEYQEATTWTY